MAPSVLAFALSLSATPPPQTPPPARSQEQLLRGTPDERGQALDAILARSASTSSIDMFLASAAALELGRVEDSGFLLYAAQLRSRVDLDRFPPRGQGGDSPQTLIASLSMQVGQAVNPALMREPQAFRAAVDRLRAWEVVAAGDYDPGWDHGTAKPIAAARASAQKAKRDYLEPAEGMATLLNTPEYFESFKVLQDSNLDTTGEAQEPERVARARQAERRLREIEEKLGIPGLYFRKPAAVPALAASAAAPKASAAARRVGGAISEPTRVSGTAPVLPLELPPDVPKTVIVELTVDAQGLVTRATILRGHPAIDDAVMDAVKRWTYEPAREYGRPVASILTVTVNLR